MLLTQGEQKKGGGGGLYKHVQETELSPVKARPQCDLIRERKQGKESAIIWIFGGGSYKGRQFDSATRLHRCYHPFRGVDRKSTGVKSAEFVAAWKKFPVGGLCINRQTLMIQFLLWLICLLLQNRPDHEKSSKWAQYIASRKLTE